MVFDHGLRPWFEPLVSFFLLVEIHTERMCKAEHAKPVRQLLQSKMMKPRLSKITELKFGGCGSRRATLGILDTKTPERVSKNPVWFSEVEAQYDWTTGVPDNGNEWRKFRVVPRLHPLRSLVLYFVE